MDVFGSSLRLDYTTTLCFSVFELFVLVFCRTSSLWFSLIRSSTRARNFTLWHWRMDLLFIGWPQARFLIDAHFALRALHE